ncbi:unnamed protein product [Adineta ricciae]|nr:unnamed protein product [Adineta ricciae]
MPTDELRQYVANLYQVKMDHVFELNILEICCPLDWSDQLEECKLEDVEKYAKHLYNKSGLDKVLDKILKTVLGEVISRCFKSAITTCQRLNTSLTNDVDIRLNGLKQVTEKLRKEIEDLDQDLEALDHIKTIQLEALKKISNTLENNLKSAFENTLNICNAQVTEIFSKNNKKWHDQDEEQQRNKQIENTEVIQTHIGVAAGATFGFTIVRNLIKYFRRDENEIEFSSEVDATAFRNNITKLVNDLSKQAYSTVEKEVNRICWEACRSFESQISEQMRNILQCARDRLQSTFNLQQIVPIKIDLKLNEIHLNDNDVERMEPYYPTIFHRLIPITLTERKSTWIVSRSTIQEKCIEGLQANLKQIQTDIVENANREMKKSFQTLFNDLQSYLLKYQKYAELCLNDKKLTEENQKEFISALEALKGRLLKEEIEVNNFNQSIDWAKLN